MNVVSENILKIFETAVKNEKKMEKAWIGGHGLV